MKTLYKKSQKKTEYKKKIDIYISDDLKNIFKKIKGAGYRALIVGGAVRDALISEMTGDNLKSKDIDIEVYGTDYRKLKEILSQFGNEIERRPDVNRVHIGIEGDSFQVLKLFIKYENGTIDDYDFSLPRRESKRKGGHKAFDIESDPNMTPKEAASRRDFTINSLSYDPIEQKIYDYFFGMEDIQNKTLRATSSAFSDDPLRVLRGLQFSARFGFELDEKTASVCKKVLNETYDINPETNEYVVKKDERNKPLLSIERIGQEWNKLFTKGKHPGALFKFLTDSGWIKIYPELDNMFGIDQDKKWHPESRFIAKKNGTDIEETFDPLNPSHTNKEEYSIERKDSLIEHIYQSLESAAMISERDRLSPRERTILLLSALCHDLGKVGTTRKEMKDGVERITSHGHDKAGVPLTKSLIDRIGIESVIGKGVKEEVASLVEYHMVHIDGYKPETEKQNIYQISDNVNPSNINMLTRLIEVDHSARVPNGNNEYTSKGMPERAKKMREDAEKKGVLNEPLQGYYKQNAGPIVDLIRDQKQRKFIGEIQRNIREEQVRGERGKIHSKKDAFNFAKERSAELVVRDWIDVEKDIIEGLGIDQNTQGWVIGKIIDGIKKEYLEGLVNNKNEAIGWMINEYGNRQAESNMIRTLKFSEHNMNHKNRYKRIEEELVDQMNSNHPKWDVIRTMFRNDEKKYVDGIKEMWESNPDFCKETYEQILDESISEDVLAYTKLTIKTASKKYEEPINIDPLNPFKDLMCYLEEKVVMGAINLVEIIEPGTLSGIIYVGILKYGEELGMFCPEFDDKVKNLYYSQNKNVSEQEILNEQKERCGVSFLINPQNIIDESHRLSGSDYNLQDEKDMQQIVLAEIFLHETVHATGTDGDPPSDGELEPIEKSRDFLTEALNLVNLGRREKNKKNLSVNVKQN